MTIVVPADNFETHEAVKAAAASPSPVYLRFGKAALYHLPDAGPFVVGRARLLAEGNDGVFVATGETVVHALLAAAYLKERDGITCRVLSVPTVKPLDSACILTAVAECGAIVTAEEHMVNGGLGEACAGLIACAGLRTRLKFAGIPDEYTVTGSQADIYRHYGLTMEGLAYAMRTTLGL